MTDTTDRFAIIPVTHGPAPDEAIVVGPMSEVMEYIPQSVARNDALEELEKARFTADQIASLQEKTRAVQASILADSVNHLSSRLAAYVARRQDAEREEARAREEAEAKRIQAELDALPDPDDPNADEHLPGGELHDLPAKAEAEQDPDPEETDDDMGGVPMSYRNVPTSYVRGRTKDQAEFEEPEDPTGTVVPQPIAVEFDGD